MLVRATKSGWFELDAQQSLVKDVVTFLAQPSRGVYLLGLRILDALVAEMNSPTPGTASLITQRKTAVSFRDASLLTVFNVGLAALRQLRDGGSPLCAPGSSGPALERLTDAAVGLVLKCLSFDFVGTSMDDSAEDVGTIQVPSSWRPALEEGATMQLFLSTYASSSPPLSCACLECLVRLASVRRSLFVSEAERAAFLARLLAGTADILRSRTGLGEHENYHEFCRLLGRLKTNYQLSELVAVDGWHDWLALVADFTVTSLHSWQWARGSVYYLLSLWARLVASVPYLKGEAPSQLDQYVPRITQAYVTTRLESVPLVATAAGGLDDPLEEEEQLSEQLESLPQLCRFQYEATCRFLCSLFDPLLGAYGAAGGAAAPQLGGQPGALGSSPPVGGGAGLVQQPPADLGVLEGQLSWLVYIVGAVIRGRQSSPTAESQEAVDGELVLRVFRLVALMDAPRHAGRSAEPRQRLELAMLGFFQHFRKVYVGEQGMTSSRVYVPLSEHLGLHDHLAVLNACVAKVSSNLAVFVASPAVVEASLGLLADLAAGYASGRMLLRLDSISYALQHHGEQHFPFLREPANCRARTVFYTTLGRLQFLEEQPLRFRAFMAPFDALCAQLAALSRDGAAFRAPHTRALLVGLLRDLRGVVAATSSRKPYCQLFEWLHPTHIPLLHATMDAFGDDPAVAIPLLKFLAELASNKTQRCTFDTSSVNGILLFREVSRLVCAYGTRVLGAAAGPALHGGGGQVYDARYKGIWVALSCVSRALAGNYVNFGVFQLYGDPALRDALDCALALATCIPPPDVLAYRKVGRAYFAFLEVLCSGGHLKALLCADARVFGHVATCLEAGLKCLDVGISSQCAAVIDAIAALYFSAQPITEASPAAAQAVARHLGAMPHLFPELLRELFEMVLFEDCANQWSLSRPMLSLILVNEAIFNDLRAQLIARQPAERRARLAACFDKLMADVTRSLDAKNRDKFTQALSVFRTELYARPPSSAATAGAPGAAGVS